MPFHHETLADLRRERLDAATVAALENVAEQYRERRARQKAARRRRTSTDAALRRSNRTRAATLSKYLKKQDSAALNYNFGELIRQLDNVALRRDENEHGGKPRDELRFQLACGIGAALSLRGGVTLNARRDGTLARVLQTVLLDCGIALEDPNHLCQDVVTYVAQLATGLADLKKRASAI